MPISYNYIILRLCLTYCFQLILTLAGWYLQRASILENLIMDIIDNSIITNKACGIFLDITFSKNFINFYIEFIHPIRLIICRD